MGQPLSNDKETERARKTETTILEPQSEASIPGNGQKREFLLTPAWPTHTRFDGDTSDSVNYLMRERPLGWLEESSKLEDMESAGCSPHLLDANIIWPVKFRLINRDTVLPSQVR